MVKTNSNVISTPRAIRELRPPKVPAGAKPATSEDIERLKITEEALKAWLFQTAR